MSSDLWLAGRVAEHILEFPAQLAGTTVVRLERNYRSTQPILYVANVLGAQAPRAFRKRLRTDVTYGARPRLVFCRDESNQASDVC